MSAAFWNGILADHAHANTIAQGVTNPVTPAELTRDQWTYKGWQIYFDMPPIPTRAFDWAAQSPDFDAEYEDGQLVCCAGQQVHAATYEALLQEIEDAIADGDDA